ncbi:hypothetical protein RBA71_05005 [Brenneria goodwinii]|uniref:hypothetical protein n=1 Tax=Brenneria goodwinii TaxID=1109412 RepID=UPI0036EBC98D
MIEKRRHYQMMMAVSWIDQKIQAIRVGDFAGFGCVGLRLQNLRVGKGYFGATPLSNQSAPKSDHHFFPMRRENEKRIGKVIHANSLNLNHIKIRKEA